MTETHFYRFIRPQAIDSTRAELKTNPKGGVCLRFEPSGDYLWFTHSRRETDSLFSKEVAKKLADTMAVVVKQNGWHELGYCGRLPITKNTDELIASVIQWAAKTTFDEDCQPSVFYLLQETKDMIISLQNILTTNKNQRENLENWKKVLAAANFQSVYAGE